MPRRVAAALAVALVAGATISPAASAPARGAADARSLGPDLNGGRNLPIEAAPRGADRRWAARAEVGDTKNWLGLDEVNRQLYLKRYKLRAESRRVEVWVANDRDLVSTRLQFPSGDCRNDGRVRVTDKQVRHLVDEFRGNIFPKESAAFGRPPARDGRRAVLPGLLGQPRGYYKGPGRRLVLLVDNVRDDNFYDADNSQNASYVAGFFSSQYNELFDRNVVTIDAFDWRHRLGPNPPNAPVPGDPCASKPARPSLYEGVLAHEYQHLLEHYRDSSEVTWVNEGLSDWAQTVTGYVDARRPISDIGFDAHVQSFLGWSGVQTTANPNPRPAGPENSLTLWSDQGEGEVLADYGAAYTFMLHLADDFGDDVLRSLHRDPGRGLGGLQSVLDDTAPGEDAHDALHRWAAMVALDEVLDDGASLTGGDPSDYSARRLDASVNWDTAHAYSAEGAPPNGSDYVRLHRDAGDYLDASSIGEIEFDGGETLVPDPVEWIVDESPPARASDPALFSGSADDIDRTIAREVTVPSSDPTLTLETNYDIDQGFDGAFVQVSEDGGATYTSLSNEHTTNDFPTGGSEAGRQAPGLTGASAGWTPMSFDLSAYAGQDVLLAFRYITDESVHESGWWVDDVAMGGVPISNGDDLEEWATPSELHPRQVSGFTVQLVAYDDAHTAAWIYELPLDVRHDGAVSGDELRAAIGESAQTVAAIVTYDEPTEDIDQYAPYTLTVDGIDQPGG